MQLVGKKKQNGNNVLNMVKAAQRKEAKLAGFYDGQFLSRGVVSQKHKIPKHKNAWLAYA
jgi:hypothetical protein